MDKVFKSSVPRYYINLGGFMYKDYEWFECVQCSYSELGCNENVCPYRLEQFKKWCKKQKLNEKCNENCIHKKECVQEV